MIPAQHMTYPKPTCFRRIPDEAACMDCGAAIITAMRHTAKQKGSRKWAGVYTCASVPVCCGLPAHRAGRSGCRSDLWDGDIFNFLPNERNAYGCELDIDAYKVASFLFPQAHLEIRISAAMRRACSLIISLVIHRIICAGG